MPVAVRTKLAGVIYFVVALAKRVPAKRAVYMPPSAVLADEVSILAGFGAIVILVVTAFVAYSL